MRDRVFENFLEKQLAEGMELARDSDLLELQPQPFPLPWCYVADFRCKGLVREPGGEVTNADHFRVGILFPENYLRKVNAAEVLTWLGPSHVWHPNISNRLPVICVGRLYPGTRLLDIIYQLYEIITYQKVTMVEHDALNKEACVWARHNTDRFPIDNRPLKRRSLMLEVEISNEVHRS